LTAPTHGMTARPAVPLAPLRYAADADGRDASYYLEERYRPRATSRRALVLYYRIKPLIPRSAQIAARRARARRMRRRHTVGGEFPRWPVEPILVKRMEAHLRDRLQSTGADRVPFIGLWPAGCRFAVILTHDVEGPVGLANVRRVLDVERRHGMVSSWNLVGDDYPIDRATVAEIAAAGGEIGLHGLSHDGRLFESRASFTRQLPGIRDRVRAWGVAGFRSPSTRRDADWMKELDVDYDSSFPDTDPFEPQTGGCCSILPYFLGRVVELPITLVQDHTLFELLREPDISIWRDKATWVAAHSGLVTVLVHPDYMLTDERLARYDELLGFLAGLEGGWHALPRDVARWWRRRATLEDALDRGEEIDGEALAAAGASVAWARERNGEMLLEPETS
jgi:peptidoglycan/xylan/chitin deacetylase (PgdA/CDA1 family)